MPFVIQVECPILGCDKEANNTGALGTHLSKVHGIQDREFRRYIVSEVKRRALNGEPPLKLTIDQLREQYNAMITQTQNNDTDNRNIADTSILPDTKPLAPSPKVLAMVDELHYNKYIKEELEGDGGVTVFKRRMPMSVRPISITLSPKTLIYYDWLKSQGYSKSLSEFINETIDLFFRERGIGIGIVVIDNE